MLRAVKLLERLRHIRHINPQAQIGSALPEGPTLGTSRTQPSPGEPIHSFAEADALLAAQALCSSRHVIIEPDRRAHVSSIASVMLPAAHQ
jgi:hypothetical protein